MPFIEPIKRPKFNQAIEAIPPFEDKGELEYFIYATMLQYMRLRKYRYNNLHDCVYAVIHAAEEFKRLNLDPREDVALAQNGGIKIGE